MATSGAFISGSMFDDSVKKLSKTELQELYKKFYDGTGLSGDVTKLSKSKLKEGIKEEKLSSLTKRISQISNRDRKEIYNLALKLKGEDR